MDDQHPEYDPDLFIHFVGEVSKNLATMAGRTKVMYKGNTMAAKAMMALQVCAARTSNPARLEIEYLAPVSRSSLSFSSQVGACPL